MPAALTFPADTLFQAARSPTDGPSQVGTPIPDNNFASVGELRPQNAKLVSSSPGAVHVLQRDVQPGDVISTGTPGAVPIAHGDVVQCRITGFETLENPVIDLKGGGA